MNPKSTPTAAPPAGSGDDLQQTRQRLLDAAGEVFAERGFLGASIREISRRAHANVAAVNYHFGDKARLYRAVLKYAHACAHDTMESLQATIPAGATPEEKLDAFVRSALTRTLAAGRPAWHGKLVAREMIEPSPALDAFVAEDIYPRFIILRTIIAEILGVPLEHDSVRWQAASVIAQALFWHHNKPVVQRLYPDLKYSDEQIEFIARHVVEFSLTGLRGARTRIRADEGAVDA